MGGGMWDKEGLGKGMPEEGCSRKSAKNVSLRLDSITSMLFLPNSSRRKTYFRGHTKNCYPSPRVNVHFVHYVRYYVFILYIINLIYCSLSQDERIFQKRTHYSLHSTAQSPGSSLLHIHSFHLSSCLNTPSSYLYPLFLFSITVHYTISINILSLSMSI